MSDEIKAAGWDDLMGIENAGTVLVELPAASEALGRPIHARIKAITPVELVKALNFPMEEMNAMAESGKSDDDFQSAVKEHVAAYDAQDMASAIRETVAAGLVEPDPKAGDIDRLKADHVFLFAEIIKLTAPKEVSEAGAAFRADGEREGG